MLIFFFALLILRMFIVAIIDIVDTIIINSRCVFFFLIIINLIILCFYMENKLCLLVAFQKNFLEKITKHLKRNIRKQQISNVPSRGLLSVYTFLKQL